MGERTARPRNDETREPCAHVADDLGDPAAPDWGGEPTRAASLRAGVRPAR